MDLIIYGSCVTRDAFPYFDPDRWKLGRYIARQSFLSINKPVSEARLTEHHFTSRFQDLMFHGDLAGDAVARLEAYVSEHPDSEKLLVIDLVDERNGVVLTPSGVLTYSYEAARDGLFQDMPAEWTLLHFGTRRHFSAFRQSADFLQSELKRLNLWNNTRVFATSWATRMTTGERAPESMGMHPRRANWLYRPYFAYLRKKGWTLIQPPLTPLGDPHHKWGPAPFHYSPDYYQAFVESLEKSI